MSVMAAQRMGVSVVSLDEDPESPAAQVGPAMTGSIYDAEAIAKIMAVSDRITLENEFIKADALREACRIANFDPANVIPGIDTLEIIQDKLLQRQAYSAFGAPTPRAVDAADAHQLGFPCVLKARYGGYDGKGTRYAKTEAEYNDLRPIWEPGGWLAEELVSFSHELAVMVVATQDGRYDAFPTVVTEQKNYVCDLVYPCFDFTLGLYARDVAIDAVKAVNGVGLFGVELFLDEEGFVKVNEIAPRPHNTGHYSLDWGGTSQFEAHIQVVLGCFGQVQHGLPTCMANLLGLDQVGSIDSAYDSVTKSFSQARFHWYGKKVAKPGRKMGHINVSGPDWDCFQRLPADQEIVKSAIASRDAFYAAWSNS